jgi:hypothetical protein
VMPPAQHVPLRQPSPQQREVVPGDPSEGDHGDISGEGGTELSRVIRNWPVMRVSGATRPSQSDIVSRARSAEQLDVSTNPVVAVELVVETAKE